MSESILSDVGLKALITLSLALSRVIVLSKIVFLFTPLRCVKAKCKTRMLIPNGYVKISRRYFFQVVSSNVVEFKRSFYLQLKLHKNEEQ